MTGSDNLFWYISVAVQFCFCLYLLSTGIWKHLPIFTIYLGSSVVASLGALYFMGGAQGPALPLSYTYYWLWVEPFLLLTRCGVALEVHGSLWKQHADIARPARPLLIFALITAIVFAAVPLIAELERYHTSQLMAMLHFEFLVMRYVFSVLAIFLVLSAVLFFFVIRGGGFQTDLFRHEGMLAVHFSIYSIAYFLVDIGWTQADLNKYMLSAFTLCLVIWISAFKPEDLLAND